MPNELDKIREKLNQEGIPLIKQIFGENLVSLILYGSAASGTFAEKVSDVNLLLLLKEPEPSGLMKLGKEAGKLISKNRISLQVLTASEFANSSDVFPMEYLDMKDNRKVLAGEDLVKDLVVTPANLRHQTEERLRGVITSLRQILLNSGSRRKVLEKYLLDWYGTQKALFRGLLRLKEVDPIPADDKGMIDKIGETFRIETEPVLRLLDYREGEKSDAGQLAIDLSRFYAELVSIVDRMDVV